MSIDKHAASLGFIPEKVSPGVTDWRRDEVVNGRIVVMSAAAGSDWSSRIPTSRSSAAPWCDAPFLAQLWAWSLAHLDVLEVCGVPIDRDVFELALLLIRQGDPVEVNIRRLDDSAQGAILLESDDFKVCAFGRSRPPTGVLVKFPDTLDDVLKRRPAMGEPTPLLWFDDDGNGPFDVRLACSVQNLTEDIEPSVGLRIEGTEFGGAPMSAAAARRIAEQLIAASNRIDGAKYRIVSDLELIEVTQHLSSHPDGWEHPCYCAECAETGV